MQKSVTLVKRLIEYMVAVPSQDLKFEAIAVCITSKFRAIECLEK